MVHDRRQDRDAAADAMAKEMADASWRHGQRQRNWQYRGVGRAAASTHPSLIVVEAINASSVRTLFVDGEQQRVDQQRRHTSMGRRDWRYQGPWAATAIATETNHHHVSLDDNDEDTGIDEQRRDGSSGRRDMRYQGPRAVTVIVTETKKRHQDLDDNDEDDNV